MEPISNLLVHPTANQDRTTQPLPKSLEQSRSEIDLQNSKRALGLSTQTQSKANLRLAFDRLWEVMAQSFGSVWAREYGDLPNSAWIAGLSDLQPSDIALGVEYINHRWSDKSFPPTMMQFRSFCLPQIQEAHKIHVKALPEPPESKIRRMTTGLAELSKMKSMVS
jgi:hypothetical protein